MSTLNTQSVSNNLQQHNQAVCLNIPTPEFNKATFAKNQIYLEDVVSALRNLSTNSVDILIADPPYNIGKDFGECKDNLPLDDYIAWCLTWIAESLRVLKDGGLLYIYGYSEILAHLLVKSEAKYKRNLIWHYTNKNAASVNGWQRSHEAILLLANSKPRFNVDQVREPYTKSYLENSAGKERAGTMSRFNKSGIVTKYVAHPAGALPRDVIKISALAGGSGAKEKAHLCLDCQALAIGKEKNLHLGHELITHPTQKPLALTRRLIAAVKNLDKTNTAVVLFAGSGAECVAARMEGCDVIGFDINTQFVQMGNAWIRRVVCASETRSLE
jgi:site-specific DNA-methyltransferase (adenine-specific)